MNRFSGTFLHGDIEKEYRHDIFAFDDDEGFFYGENKLIINNRNATFFLWESTTVMDKFRGLLVYDDDEESYKWAMEKFCKREQVL